MELSQWWQLLIAGGAGAGLIKLLDNLLMHLLNRKAKKQDSWLSLRLASVSSLARC